MGDRLIHCYSPHGAHAGEVEVNVYSYRQPFLIKPMFDAFTRRDRDRRQRGLCQERIDRAPEPRGSQQPGGPHLHRRYRALTDAVNAGVTQPARSTALKTNIPPQYRDPDYQWFGLTARARILVASKDRVQPGELSTYEDLADPEWKGRICTRSAKNAYMVALTAAMIAHHGEAEAEQWLRGVKANLARKPQGNDRAQVKAIMEGVCDVAIINHYYMGKMMADKDQAAWAASVNMIYPNQESYGTHMNVSGMALTKSAPNRENAIKLMVYLSDELAQQMYAEQNFEYPVKQGVPWPGLLQSFGSYKADDLALAEIARHRRAASMLADKVGYDN